jgi:hypothetical protein
MGTAVGTMVFLQHGWRAGAALSVAWMGWQLAILLLRGPHTDRWTWFGYQGGTRWSKAKPETSETKHTETPQEKDVEKGK